MAVVYEQVRLPPLIWFGSADTVKSNCASSGPEDCESPVKETGMSHAEEYDPLGARTASWTLNKLISYECRVPSCADTTGL